MKFIRRLVLPTVVLLTAAPGFARPLIAIASEIRSVDAEMERIRNQDQKLDELTNAFKDPPPPTTLVGPAGMSLLGVGAAEARAGHRPPSDKAAGGSIGFDLKAFGEGAWAITYEEKNKKQKATPSPKN